jgi:hypothetical protein
MESTGHPNIILIKWGLFRECLYCPTGTPQGLGKYIILINKSSCYIIKKMLSYQESNSQLSQSIWWYYTYCAQPLDYLAIFMMETGQISTSSFAPVPHWSNKQWNQLLHLPQQQSSNNNRLEQPQQPQQPKPTTYHYPMASMSSQG